MWRQQMGKNKRHRKRKREQSKEKKGVKEGIPVRTIKGGGIEVSESSTANKIQETAQPESPGDLTEEKRPRNRRAYQKTRTWHGEKKHVGLWVKEFDG